jgi:hypothetical protein
MYESGGELRGGGERRKKKDVLFPALLSPSVVLSFSPFIFKLSLPQA